MLKKIIFILCLGLLGASPGGICAVPLEDEVRELKEMVRELRTTVERQQGEIESLKRGAATPAPEPVPSAAVASAAAPGPVRPGAGKWNPDIGVVADMLARFDSPKEDAEGADRLSVRELELILGSYVDPYSRLDVNIGFSDFEDVHLEEAYLTRFGLPLDSTARIGRVKPKIGKAIPSHRDVLETADYPVVIRRWFGEDGLSKTGVDVTKPLDLPFDSAHEMTLGVLEGGSGEGGTAFGDSRRRPTLYGHLKSFWDIGEATNLEIGLSPLAGSSEADNDFETFVLGADATWIHFLGPDQRLKLQGEAFWMQRADPAGDIDADLGGFYGVFDWRFNKQWASGFRFDYAELVDNAASDPEDKDIGYTTYITFHQTEFARWRIQFNHLDLANGDDDDQILLQGIFAIGEHKHKLQ